MLDCTVSENILGQVSVQLEMTSHDWSKLKNVRRVESGGTDSNGI